MSKDTDYVSTLIEFTVSEDNERVDLEACLEVADRANATKAECLEAIKMITKCLGKSNPKIILNTISLLETMCKNCNMRFLYELNNKKLVDALLKVLTRRRDRAKYGTKASKSSNAMKIEAEDRILYLIQLWADTFMMHQAEFRNIHDAYRVLRKDGVQFPERDPSEKFMINFQGQTSPIFLAMEENITVPSNNQGGPVPDMRKGGQTFKPRQTEYKHEQPATSQVQNTLYDENDEDYDYSAYDGIQITQDEVKILDESMGILKEIERNATKPADMKGEIAKEILSDLVHVHKRLKRFLKTEKFASASHKNEAIKLNQALSTCLSNYKTKYYKLKEDQRRIKTEPDEEVRERYEYNEDYGTESNQANRMATDFGDSGPGAYTDRVRPSNDIGFDPKKKTPIPIRKINISNNKVAPPTGWQPPLSADRNQNLGGNPDLIDLLNTRDTAPAKPTTKAPQNKLEERKESTQKPKPSQDIFHDLLDINFSTEPAQPSKPQNNVGHGAGNKQAQHSVQQNFDQVFANQFHTAPNEASSDPFDFVNFDTGASSTKPQVNTSGQKSQQKAFPQPNFMISPKGKITSPTQPGANTTDLLSTKVEANDDDDFFNDIANRKK